MSNKKIIFYFLLLLAYCSIIAVGYWERLYLIDTGNDLRHELRIGAAMVMMYTFPIWLGVAFIAIIWKQHLKKIEILCSFVPVTTIVLLVLSWGA